MKLIRQICKNEVGHEKPLFQLKEMGSRSSRIIDFHQWDWKIFPIDRKKSDLALLWRVV